MMNQTDLRFLSSQLNTMLPSTCGHLPRMATCLQRSATKTGSPLHTIQITIGPSEKEFIVLLMKRLARFACGLINSVSKIFTQSAFCKFCQGGHRKCSKCITNDTYVAWLLQGADSMSLQNFTSLPSLLTPCGCKGCKQYWRLHAQGEVILP